MGEEKEILTPEEIEEILRQLKVMYPELEDQRQTEELDKTEEE
ncbi:hypothetical protein [Gordoniibacillus kamchatkensis]|nr:hypothetical protein [Paenibacillus sp. VKM B-2647]